MRLGLAARRLVRFMAMRARGGTDRVRVVLDVPYVDDGHPKHRLDLYLPRAAGTPPIVLFVHGGFWRNQDRRYLPAITGLYGNVGTSLAARGIAVVVPSYRLSPTVGIEAQITDVLAALRWTIEHPEAHGADPSRLVLAGFSAGGHLVTLPTLDPTHLERAGIAAERIRGLVTLSGLLDLHAMARQMDATFNEEVTDRLFGRTAGDRARWSPSDHLRNEAPPLLAFAAERDYPFVLSSGRTVAERLGGRFEVVSGIGHAEMALDIDTPRDQVSARFAAFVHDVTAP